MPLKTQQDELPSLNLTPMIDVVFLLIIFFMVGTQFTGTERKIKLQVPEVASATALTAAPEKRVINVYPDGSITLDRKSVTLSELTSQLAAARAEYPDLGVLVRGDGSCPLQKIATVLSCCREAGISQMGISVRVGDAQKETTIR
jgi:biopolymer transport protein ExbD